MLTIAPDSNALKVFVKHSAVIYKQVQQGALQIYLPVVVYAEQVIYPGSALPNILDTIPITIIPLTQTDADKLGALWPQILIPMDRQKKRRFWDDNKMDCLIAAMALQHEWLVITNNTQDFSYFEAAGLQFCSVGEFVTRFLGQENIREETEGDLCANSSPS